MENDVNIRVPVKGKGTPASIALRMENIQISVDNMTAKINALKAKRAELLRHYEELKQAKEIKEREIEIQQGCEWDKGEPTKLSLVHDLSFIIHFVSVFIVMHF